MELVSLGGELQPHDGRTALERLVAGWLLAQTSSNTRRAYGRAAGAWVAWCVEHELNPLTVGRLELDAYRETLTRASKAPASIAASLSALSSLYAYLVDVGAIAANPVIRVKRPKLSPDFSPTEAPDAGEAKAMLRAAREDGPRTAALVALMLTVGLRADEIGSATVPDLGSDRGHRTITVTRKGGHRQRLVIPPATWHVLEVYLGGRVDGPILATSTGRAMAPSEIFRTIQRVARKAGLDKQITPHSLRHACATLALDAGADLADVQDLLGHADPRTTRRYDRARNRLDRSPAYAVAQALADDDRTV